MALTRKQLAALHVGKKALGLDDDAYRATLQELTGCSSAKELEHEDFAVVVRHFQSLGWRPKWSQEIYGYRLGMATPAQLSYIRALWSEFTHGEGTDRTFGKWLHRTFRCSAPRFLTSDRAPKVITALKSMTEQRAGARAAS